MKNANEADFKLLRARVEAKLRPPAVLLVTSAVEGDGKRLTTYGLAQALAVSGYSTAIMDEQSPTNPHPQLVAQMHCDPAVDSRAALARVCERMRSSYDFTLVTVGALPSKSLAMTFARLADGIILSYRLGRRELAQDAELKAFFNDCSVQVIGLVAASQDAINRFMPLSLRDAGKTAQPISIYDTTRTVTGLLYEKPTA